MLRRRLIGTVAALVVTSTLAACGDDGAADPPADTTTTTAAPTTTTTAPIAARRPFTSSMEERTFDRPLPDGQVRSLLTEVWLPDGDGPFPLISFAHGNDGHPRKFHELFGAWAAAGYAVVAPRFPVSADDANRSLAESLADGPQQNLDLEFVTQQVITEYGGQVDGERTAVAGLSLGGGTALQASYSDCCPGLTPKVVVAFSPVPFATEQAADAPPLLLVHGTADRTLPYSGSADLFAGLTGRRWFLTLTDAGHADPYEDTPSPHDELVRTVSIDVLAQFVLGDPDGVSRAEAAIAASGLGSVESAG